MLRSNIAFLIGVIDESEAPPVPIWIENPSLNSGRLVITVAIFWAIISSLGEEVKRIAPPAILEGSPIESMTTTQSTKD